MTFRPFLAIKSIITTAFACVLFACGGAANQNVTPSASFVANAITATAPATVGFDASASADSDGSIVSYFWDFGDGSTGSGVNINHQFAKAGNFTVALTVTDNQGAQSRFTKAFTFYVRQNAAPVAVISTDKTRGLGPLTVQLSASQSLDDDGQVVAYLWQFPDGSTSTQMSLSRVVTSPGDYLVKLTVTDNDGGQGTAQVVITVVPESATFSISGVITALPYTDVDGDSNDPNAAVINNNGDGAAAYQSINNPTRLNGFVTSIPTGRTGDRFELKSDVHDIYTVKLKAGDYVSMRVIDSSTADIDLHLFDAKTSDLIVSSTGNNEFESLRAPADGQYLVMVYAQRSGSKYLMTVGDTSLVAGPRSFGKSGNFEPDQAIVKMRDGNLQSMPQATVTGAQLEMSHKERGRAALARMNRFNPQTRTMLKLQANRTAFEARIAQANPSAFAKLETLRAISHLAGQADVEFAEPNYRVRPLFVPTDPFYKYQWHYPAINLPQAWDVTRGDPKVIVAVVDTGVFLAHPDLKGKLLPGYDFISSTASSHDGDGIDSNPDDPGDETAIGDSSWHGTHIAGTIAAIMGNGIGGVGVAPGVMVMPLRVLGIAGGSDYDVLQAVRYAAGLSNDSKTLPARNADIINLSLGSPGYSQATQDLYNQIYEKGIIVVAAAGNESSTEPSYPASYNGVVSVAAIDYSGERAYYSNTGAYIDLAAPGGLSVADQNFDGYSDGVLSTSVVQDPDGTRKSSYRFYQGTSMASPHVAGVAALMKSVDPTLTASEFQSLLVSGAITHDAGAQGRDNEYGYGVIDAQLAVTAATDLARGGSTAAIFADRVNVTFSDLKLVDQVEIRAIGNTPIHLTNFGSNANWLKISALSVDSAGIGKYTLSVDSTNLKDGTYTAVASFYSDRGDAIRIQVTLELGQVIPVGNAGHLYIALLDSTGASVTGMDVSASGGRYEYRFDKILVGDYYLAAGSDVDNDNSICDAGESCGYYPSMNEFSLIRLDRDRPNTDFSAGLFESVGSATLKIFRSETR